MKTKILQAIENNRLSLKKEGERYWYNYKLRITKLFWERNIYDGYLIEVYDKCSNRHIDTLKV